MDNNDSILLRKTISSFDTSTKVMETNLKFYVISKLILVFLLYVSRIQAADSNCSCSSFSECLSCVKTTSERLWEGFLNIFQTCPIRQNYREKVIDLLRQRLFGQPLAIETIERAFRIHQHGRPLTFHFVGVCFVDNGIQDHRFLFLFHLVLCQLIFLLYLIGQWNWKNTSQ
jgi:hypothetical protein